MSKRLFVFGLAVALSAFAAVVAEGAESSRKGRPSGTPKIVSWSNSKTEDQSTVFQVKPGQKITFNVKAEGAEKYLWQVNGETKPQVNGASLKWTVPNEKGMWKIRAVATNTPQEQYVGGLVRDFREFPWGRWDRRAKKWITDKNRREVPETIKDGYYPPQCRKEWIVSTFLKQVKPGGSIQEAIGAIPPEGGVIVLLPGLHEVKGTIHINKSNVAIQGGDDSEIRSHDPTKSIFSVNEEWEGRPHLENVTFRGFKSTSTYNKRGRNVLIMANQVNNLTIEGLRDMSFVAAFVGINGARDSRGRLYYARSEGMLIINNTIRNSGRMNGFMARNSTVAYNTMSAKQRSSYGMYWEVGNTNISIHHNYLENAAVNGNIQTESNCAHIFENVCRGSQGGIWVRGSGPDNVRIENNIITGATVCGVGTCRQGTQRNLVIANNLIYDCPGSGVLFIGYGHSMRKGSTGGAKIINNVIYNCGRDGIAVRLPENYRGKPVNFDVSDSLVVTNNIVANIKGCGIVPCKNKGACLSSHNNFWNIAKGKYGGACKNVGDISAAPLFADPSKGDFHLKSKAGRWDAKLKKWVKDNATSPCIDAGDAKSEYKDEPQPNGGRINVGAYGNTNEASKSPK